MTSAFHVRQIHEAQAHATATIYNLISSLAMSARICGVNVLLPGFVSTEHTNRAWRLFFVCRVFTADFSKLVMDSWVAKAALQNSG
jgi:hypothetical protein